MSRQVPPQADVVVGGCDEQTDVDVDADRWADRSTVLQAKAEPAS